MIQLIYTSVATKHLGTDQLFDMLMECRLNNRRRNMTGLLLFCNMRFIQVLEGPEEQVEALYQKISQDPRHKDCDVLCKKAIQERIFKDWEMGFKRLSSLNFDALKGYSKFFEPGNSLKNTPGYYGKVLEYLVQFKDMTLDE